MEKSKIQQSSWIRGSCIGRGSFGTVNLAVDKSDGHIFVVKSVERNTSLPYKVEALENEIKILRSISSPYVVEYLGHDMSVEQATSYRNLHVEYLPGGTAAELAGADVEEGLLRSYTRCIVSALMYVHSLGIVHCDVKGNNVLVGPTPGTAKLADFGSAKESATPMSPRGSPLWMAPEVVRGEYQGPESDVWSLGCTVIEMVTGKPAWEDRGGDTLCRIGYSEELPEIPSKLSTLGQDFVDKCLRRKVCERWSCDQLLQHPFVSSCAPPTVCSDWSPRCVLDWFDDDEEDDQVIQIESSRSDASERIGKLASKVGAIWESDGWMFVRHVTSVTEESCDLEEGERVSSVTEDEIFLEYLDSGLVEGCLSCPFESQKTNWAVERGEMNIFNSCKVNLLLSYLLCYCKLVPVNLQSLLYCNIIN
ncbi:hypothetical protein LguiB_031070 [Lonicera macranthoides]